MTPSLARGMVPAVSGSETVSLRITLRYKTLDELVERYAENISSAGLFLRTRSPKPTGTKIRFELLLADGSRALRGEGVVVQIRDDDKPGMALRFNVLDADSQLLVDRIVEEHGEGQLAPTPLSTPFADKKRTAPERSTSNWRGRSRSGWTGSSAAATTPKTLGGRVLPSRPARPAGEGRPLLPRRRSSVSRPWADGPASKTLPSLARGEDKLAPEDRTLRLDANRLGQTEPKNTGSEIIVEDPSLLPQPAYITTSQPNAEDKVEDTPSEAQEADAKVVEESLAATPGEMIEQQTQLVAARGPDGFPVPEIAPEIADETQLASTTEDTRLSADEDVLNDPNDLSRLAEAVVDTASEVASRPSSGVGFQAMIREASDDTATVRPEEPEARPVEVVNPDQPVANDAISLAGAENRIAGVSEDVGPETAVIESPLQKSEAQPEAYTVGAPDPTAPVSAEAPAPVDEPEEPVQAAPNPLVTDDNILPQSIPDHLDAPWSPGPEHLAYREPTDRQTATEAALSPDESQDEPADTQDMAAAHVENDEDAPQPTVEAVSEEAHVEAAIEALSAQTEDERAVAELDSADVESITDSASELAEEDNPDEAPAAVIRAADEDAEAETRTEIQLPVVPKPALPSFEPSSAISVAADEPSGDDFPSWGEDHGPLSQDVAKASADADDPSEAPATASDEPGPVVKGSDSSAFEAAFFADDEPADEESTTADTSAALEELQTPSGGEDDASDPIAVARRVAADLEARERSTTTIDTPAEHLAAPAAEISSLATMVSSEDIAGAEEVVAAEDLAAAEHLAAGEDLAAATHDVATTHDVASAHEEVAAPDDAGADETSVQVQSAAADEPPSEDVAPVVSSDIEAVSSSEAASVLPTPPAFDEEDEATNAEAAPIFPPPPAFEHDEEATQAAPSDVFPPPPAFVEEEPTAAAGVESPHLEPESRPAARHDFEARTEIIRAEGVSESSRSPFSTQVQVVGLTAEGEPVTSDPVASTPPALRSRPVVERSGLSGDPEHLLQRARNAAFSEENTEVPPERENVTHQVRARRPGQANARGRARAAGRPVGLDLGHRWARIGYLEQGELQLQPIAGSAYVPALVGYQHGRVLVGTKALGLLRSAPDQTAWVHDLLNIERTKRHAEGRGEKAKVQMGEESVEVESLLSPFFGRLFKSASHPETGRSRAIVLWSGHSEAAKKRLARVLDDGGTEIVRFVSPMEAAVAAFNLNERPVPHFLLVDVGATTVEIHVATRKGNVLEAVRNETHERISARSIDEAIVTEALAIHHEDGGPDLREDTVVRARVLEVIEGIRPDIGRLPEIELKVSLPNAQGAVGDATIILPRVRAYQASEGVVTEICKTTQNCVRQANLDPRTMGAVLISGSGGSYPPLLEAMRALTQTEPILGLPPAQVLTMGLARLGLQAEREESAKRDDALSASIGIELPGGRLGVLLRAGIRLPANVTRRIPTTRDNQTSMELKLYQGDAEYVKSCKFLSRVSLDEIPKGLRGEVDIELMASVDRQGVLTVRLSEPSSSATGDLVMATAQTPEQRKEALSTADLGRPTRKRKGGLFKRLLGLDG